MLPVDPIEKHFRLTPQQQAALRRLAIETVHDLLYHFPVRYESVNESSTVSALAVGNKVTLYGTLSGLKAKKLWKSRRPATEGWFEDASGKVKVMWFNQPYIARMAPQGTMVKLTGSVSGGSKPYITNPEVEVLTGEIPDSLFTSPTEKEDTPVIFPVYPETQGITSRWFYHAFKRVHDGGVLEHLEDPLPESLRTRYHLPDIHSALLALHAPQSTRSAEAARKRFSFEEIFVIQLHKQQERARNATQHAFEIDVDEARIKKFIALLPFPLTGAQERAVKEILTDFEKLHPMARLLEGDVGSGKTAVAAITAYAAVTSRPKGRVSGTLQVAYMAPTEILATQHFQSFIEFFKELPINIALITGSGCYKYPSKIDREKPTTISRSQLLKWIKSGEIAMLVGTHALVQKTVAFEHLAYVIVDEQHRFGTAQRRALARKGDSAPHFLSMSATPIPRTLALTMYGDLDLSVLDELPKGRAGVTTKIISKEKRASAYEAIREELKKGRQAYVICPRIDEPDPEKALALIAKSAKAEAKRLQQDVFPEFSVGLMHGKLKPQDKDAVMKAFSEGSTNVLVSTSVVEVGVNVPNATVIAIEGAERFGLAQLHQLRGRVLRSSHEAFCFLLPETTGEYSRARLQALEKTRDGFALAEEDLKLRGAGDLYGANQWGVSDLGMDALKNPRLIEAARNAAQETIAHDPELTKHPLLKTAVAGRVHELHEE